MSTSSGGSSPDLGRSPRSSEGVPSLSLPLRVLWGLVESRTGVTTGSLSYTVPVFGLHPGPSGNSGVGFRVPLRVSYPRTRAGRSLVVT